jgi:hypothetical protein
MRVSSPAPMMLSLPALNPKMQMNLLVVGNKLVSSR